MRLSQADRRRGFKDDDAQALAFFREAARVSGLSPGDLYRAESRYLSEHRQWRTEADREAFLRQSVASLGFDTAAQDAVWDDVATIAESGEFPHFDVPAPSPAEDARRLEEIGDVLRTDRRTYDKLNLGDEAQDIRARLGDEAGMSVRPTPADAPARSTRIDELKQQMRDPSSSYWRGPKAEATQEEYRRLVGGGGEPAGVSSDASAGGLTRSPQTTGGASCASDNQSAFPADNQGN